MFITHETDRHQLFSAFSGGAENTTYWRRFELALFRPWFLVTLSFQDLGDENKDSPMSFSRTMGVGDVKDLTDLLKQDQEDHFTVQSVQVIFLDFKSEKENWSIQKVRAIWAAEQIVDDTVHGAEIEIVETVDGVMLPTIPVEPLYRGREGLRLIHEI